MILKPVSYTHLAEAGKLVTFGIVPDLPETGYGYIRRGEVSAGEQDTVAFEVAQFVEKPNLETAQAYVASGEYYWNSGCLLYTSVAFQRVLVRYQTESGTGLRHLPADGGGVRRTVESGSCLLYTSHEDDEQVTIRNIRLQMEQDPQHRGSFEFSGRVNRDQRDLTISLNGTVDASDYPHDLMAAIEQINWQLQGADLPKQGIQGQGSFQVQWQESHKRLSFNQISLTANDSTLSGQAPVSYTHLDVYKRQCLPRSFD